MAMNAVQIVSVALMATFYAVYLGKMIAQKRQGIRTDVLGSEGKPLKERAVEGLLKAMTYGMVAVELGSIIVGKSFLPRPYAWGGVAITAVGVGFFIAAVLTMRDSWRAGISPEEKTALVTDGVYSISRNPAFVGFDLTYIGLCLSFANVVNIVCAVLTMLLFHLQILQEEKFLLSRSDIDYAAYKNKVRRYL